MLTRWNFSLVASVFGGKTLISSPLPFPRLEGVGLPLVVRALHKYHVAENERDAVEHSSVEERNACDAAQRLVSMLCERLCSAWGSSAVVSAANRLRYSVSGIRTSLWLRDVY